VTLLGLYAVSVRPARAFFGGSIDPWTNVIFNAFYAPLYWVCERAPPFARAVEFWGDLWWRLGRKGGAPFHFPSR
jgi:hypothetical protein